VCSRARAIGDRLRVPIPRLEMAAVDRGPRRPHPSAPAGWAEL